MLELLLKARIGGRYLVIADIRRAYNQIEVREQDRSNLRFLWIRRPDRPLNYYNLRVMEFNRVCFGIAGGPYLLDQVIATHLQRVILNSKALGLTAEKSSQAYSNTVFKLRQGIYVDNIQACFDDAGACLLFYRQATEIFKRAGMDLAKWLVNNTIHPRQFTTTRRNSGVTADSALVEAKRNV